MEGPVSLRQKDTSKRKINFFYFDTLTKNLCYNNLALSIEHSDNFSL